MGKEELGKLRPYDRYEPEEEKKALEEVQNEFRQIMRDRIGDLTEDELSLMDEECDQAMRAAFVKGRQMGMTRIVRTYTKATIGDFLRTKAASGRSKNADGHCTKPDCKEHGKK